MKKLTKKALSIALCVVMLMSTFVMGITASATVVDSGKCGDNLTWELDDEGTLTISGTGTMSNYQRTPSGSLRIAVRAVIISNGVTSIGVSAFEKYSNLTSITIPNSVTSIGDYAFYGCNNLKNIFIPASVSSMGRASFKDCYALTNVTFGANCKLVSIGVNAFESCKNLKSISIPNRVISIGDGAFSYCKGLENITIPKSVISIGEGAFQYCTSLSDVYYSGNEDDKYNIDISNKNPTGSSQNFSDNQNLLNATWHYNTVIVDEPAAPDKPATHTHSYKSSVTTKATCTKAGVMTYVCSCGNSYTKAIPATGHKDANADKVCDVCGAKITTLNAKINVASAKSVDYKAQVTIKATANGVPAGYSLAMYVNGKQVAKGSNTEVTYTVGQATSDINYTVKVIDAKGNVQKDSANKDLAKDSKVTVNASFFAKIIAFFKSLFGSLSKVEVKP